MIPANSQSNPIPILMYHSVTMNVSATFQKWAVTPALFANHLAYLRQQHYTLLTITELLTAIDQNTLPARPLVLTFDDGFADFYDDALPILRSFDAPATLYVVAGLVGKTSRWLATAGEGLRPLMTWQQLAELPHHHIEIGAHTCYHPQLDTISLAQAREEIVCAKTWLEKRLLRPVNSFAYPHGYHSRTIRNMVIEAGYDSACGVKHALSAVADDRFALSRIIITADTSVDDLALLIQGQGLRIAPQGEQLRTTGWRMVRRAKQLLAPKELHHDDYLYQSH